MPNFVYSAYNSAGDRIDGEIEASNAGNAADQLHKKGLLAFRTEISTVAADGGQRAKAAAKSASLSLIEFATFARQLATLLQAELPLDQCLRLVASQAGKTRAGRFSERLATLVVAGRSFSDAIESEAPNAPPFIAPLVRAGEARGTLTPCLTDLANILERRVEVQGRFRSAMVYPSLLLVLAMATIALVVGVLVPTLMPLFKDSGTPPPLTLQLAEDLGLVIANYWLPLLAVAVALIGLSIWLFRRPSVVAFIDTLLLRLPGIGLLVRRTNVAIIARTLGSLLHNGVPLVAALSLTATVASSALFRRSLLSATQAVKEGSKLTAALQRQPAFPDMALRFIAIGEEASRLDDMLLHLAEVSDTEAHRQIEGLLTLLTPAITLFVGVFIGGLILSVMQAVLSVNDIALQ